MSEAEQIARKLTKAQREVLIEGGPCVYSYKPGQRMIALGLWEDRHDGYTIKGAITPLGLEVRSVLEGEHGNG